MTDQKVFSGNLRFISLTNVFKLLGENNCTGVLSLTSDYTEFIGLIYFVNGNAINGSFGDLKGLKAVYSMFGWTEGNYEFLERELSHINPVIKQSGQEIIIQAFKMLTGGEIKRIGPLKPEQAAIKKEEAENEYFILIDEPSEQTSDTTLEDPIDTETTTADAVAPDQTDVKDELVEHELFHMMDEPSEQASDTTLEDPIDAEATTADEVVPAQIDVKDELVEHELFHMMDEPSEQASDTILENPIDAEATTADEVVPAQTDVKDELVEHELFHMMDEPSEQASDTTLEDPIDAEATIVDAVAPAQTDVKDELIEHELFHMIDEHLEDAEDTTPDDPTDTEMTMAEPIPAAQVGISDDDIEKEFLNLFSAPLENISDMVTDDSGGAEAAIGDSADFIQMETVDKETESELLNSIKESLEPACTSSPVEPMDAEIAKDVPIMSDQTETKNNEAESESFDLNLEDSMFGHNASFNRTSSSDDSIDLETAKNGPMSPNNVEINIVAAKSGSLNPIEEPSERACSRCGTPLGADGVEESLFDHNVCFRCDMISDGSVDAETQMADPLAPKLNKLKIEEAKKKTPVPVKESLKPVRDAIPGNSMDTEIKKTSPSATKLNKMKTDEVKKKPPVPIKKSLEPVSAKIPDDPMDAVPRVGKPMDENGFNLISILKSKLQSWGPFHYFVTTSIVLAWVVVGIIFFSDSEPSSPKPELAIPEKTTPRTEVPGQEKTVQAPVTQTAIAANNTNPLRAKDGASGQVKPTQVAENKPAASVNNAGSSKPQAETSSNVATPQEKEKKSTPAPIEKIERQPDQILTQPANTVEKDTDTKASQKEVAPLQAPVKETEVQNLPETKGVIESHETAEKIEVPKQAPPAKEVIEREQAIKPAIVTKDPEFPGGKAALAKWLSSHITIPQSVTRSGVEGNVIVELTIDSQDGKISNVAIVKSLQKQCDQEVVRVVSKMPNWKPGEVNGEKTTSKYNLSVRFAAQ